MSEPRDPATDPQHGDIVRSTVFKNGRERHVVGRDRIWVFYHAVGPTCTRALGCSLRAWQRWCVSNRVEIVQVKP